MAVKQFVNQTSVRPKPRNLSHARRRSEDFLGTRKRRFEADRTARLAKKWGRDWPRDESL